MCASIIGRLREQRAQLASSSSQACALERKKPFALEIIKEDGWKSGGGRNVFISFFLNLNLNFYIFLKLIKNNFLIVF
jgi:hypothetical protein